MAWFKKKPDPISDRARVLSAEIAELEAEIQRLDAQLQQDQSQPKLRAPALPLGANVAHVVAEPTPPAALQAHEPIFEDVDRAPLAPVKEPSSTPDHYNELGVRKYDLPALLRRLRGFFHGPSTTNPKLVSYLAAGGIQGLRSPRYERRVARNRFIAFVAVLVLALLCVLALIYHGH